jgi:ABC-type polar amino acid transport system ATPase subunit
MLSRVGLTDKIGAYRTSFPAASSNASRSRERWWSRIMLFDEPTSALDPEMIRGCLTSCATLPRAV